MFCQILMGDCPFLNRRIGGVDKGVNREAMGEGTGMRGGKGNRGLDVK